MPLLPGPPGSPTLGEISWLLPNGPELAGSAARVRVSAETNNRHRQILAELSPPSEFPETETVSTETRFDRKVTTRPVQGSGADETIRPFDVRPVRNPFRLNRDFAPSICSVA